MELNLSLKNSIIRELIINCAPDAPMLRTEYLYDGPYDDLADAIMAIINAVVFGQHRGQVLMPTATGKTLVISEAARILIEKYQKNAFVMTGSTIVLALQHYETLKKHVEETETRFGTTKILLVCSDKERKKYIKNGDILEDVTTNPEDVAGFIMRQKQADNPYIIISTYHSLEKVVGKSYAMLDDRHLDITFYDEAHNATNPYFSSTVYSEDEEGGILEDTPNYQSEFRFFLTATPRKTVREDLEKKEKIGTRKVGMDNPVFGPVLYEMTTKEAVILDLITSLVVIISELKGEYENHMLKSINLEAMRQDSNVNESELRAEAVLNYGGLTKLYEEAGKVKAIVYCRSVAHAKSLDENINWAEALGIPGLITRFVASSITGAERDRRLNDFANAENAIIFNYRVLSEGVNIEDVNAVVMLRAFEDAVTLAQAIGRTLRLDPNDRGKPRSEWKKKHGYVILPESMGRSQDKEYILGRSMDYIKALYQIGFEDTRIMGFTIAQKYGEGAAKRVKKYLKEKYGIEYYDENINSLAELFAKYGKVAMVDVMSEILGQVTAEEDQEIMDELGL